MCHLSAPPSSRRMFKTSGPSLRVLRKVVGVTRLSFAGTERRPNLQRIRSKAAAFTSIAVAVAFLAIMPSIGLGLGSPPPAQLAVPANSMRIGMHDLPPGSNTTPTLSRKSLAEAAVPSLAGLSPPRRLLARQLAPSAYGLYETTCGELQVCGPGDSTCALFNLTFRSHLFLPSFKTAMRMVGHTCPPVPPPSICCG